MARNSESPKQSDWTAVKREIRDLKGTIHLSLHLSNTDGTLQGFPDADWGGLDTRRSTSAYCFMLGRTTISWRSSREKCVALSSSEAEFTALSEAGKKAVWIRTLLSELGMETSDGTSMFVDNQTAMTWGNDGIRKAKHVAIRRNFVKELVDQGKLSLRYCPTESMPADLFTKPLARVKFEKHVKAIGLHGPEEC